MDTTAARERILAALQGLAPEVDVRAIRPDRPLREQIDLDSLDWLTLADRVGEILGVDLRRVRLGPGATMDDWLRAAGRAGRAGRAAKGRPDRASPGVGAPPAPRRGGPLPAAAGRAAVARLADGRRVRLRPIVAADAPLLAQFVRGLSPESRYRRFMVSLRELPPAKLKSLTQIDPARHVALAAMPLGRRPPPWIGVAHCIADADGGACEFALTVADEWQHTGLAGVLMRALMAGARARGFRSMRGEVLASNRPMLRLARQLGFLPQPHDGEGGSVQVARAL